MTRRLSARIRDDLRLTSTSDLPKRLTVNRLVNDNGIFVVEEAHPAGTVPSRRSLTDLVSSVRITVRRAATMAHPRDSSELHSHILVEDQDRGFRRSEPLPHLDPADAAALEALLEVACSQQGRWHRLPESDLAFRAASDHVETGSFLFEIRDDRFPDEPRSYRYNPERLALACKTDHTVELLELPHDHRLPRDTDEFALAVAAGLSKCMRSTG